MPYAMLEKDIESLDETQQNAVALFVRFLLSKKPDAQIATSPRGQQGRKRDSDWNLQGHGKIPLWGALKDKIKFIAPDFDEPLEDFSEYM